MAMSEELQRRISNLTGDVVGSSQMTEAEGARFMEDAKLMSNQTTLGGQFSEREAQKLMSLPESEKLALIFQAGRNRLGAQFTEKEGERLLENLNANPSAEENINLMKVMSAMEATRYDTSIPEIVATGRIEESDETIAQRAQDQELRAYQERARTAPSMAPMNPMRDQMEAVAPDMGTDQKMIELQEAINELQQQKSMTNDPEEIEALDRMIETATTKALAPQAELIEELSQTAGEDNMMAHVRSGDLNISREMLENNPQLEDAIERAALEKGIDPESMVFGAGIASLNAYTGAEEHGFLKKLGKGLKKVLKVVAPIAMFVPGVGTALGGVLGGIGGLATKIPGIGGALGSIGSTVAKGIAKLGIPGISSIAGGTTGGFGNVLTGLGNPLKGGMFGKTGSMYYGGPEAGKGIGNLLGMGSGTPAQVAQEQLSSMTPQEMAENPSIVEQLKQAATSGISNAFSMNNADGGLSGMGMLGIGALSAGLGKLAYEDTKKDKGVQLTPLNTMNATGRYNMEAEIARRMGQQAPNPTEFGLLPANTMPQLSGGQPRPQEQVMAAAMGGEVMNYQDGGSAQYPNKGLESLAQVAPEAVRAMGYNMGGQAMMPMNYNMGGRPMMPMAYAEGGNVAMEDFDRMNGRINGGGTETSDDIPAMLSDGEFVMTGQAVRGAGSYAMNNDGGILTLSPSGSPDREAGTNTMYQLMEAFSGQARPA